MKILVLGLAAAGLAAAQIGYPGGYPPTGRPGGYPPGYPGGYPPGYPGPYPGGGPVPQTGPGGGAPSPKSSKKQKKSKDQGQPLPNFRGKLKQLDSKSISLKLDDDRIMEFRITGKTTFTKNGEQLKSPKFDSGDQISVEATEEPDASLTAVNVYWEKAASAAAADSRQDNKDGTVDTWKDVPKEPAHTSEVSPAPGPADPNDPGPPTLKRGKPAPRADVPVEASPTAPPTAPQPAPRQTASAVPLPTVDLPPVALPKSERPEDQVPIAPRHEDALIQKAADAALEFTETLPNYVVQEMMSRSESSGKPADWRPLDVVTMDVVYESGKENYKNIAINGKATSKPLSEIGGAYSTGEFGTMLIDLFAPATAAEFHPKGESRIAGATAKTYDFEVKRENSHWDLHFGPQTYSPTYSGSVWIDPSTGRVLRIEMQAKNLPKDFPADQVESATDYQYVRLGGTQQFLLPVHAETLSCQRGTSYCSRNTIDFRNYHKYTGESSVEFSPVK
ncbi:MAG TPA: hypothetical protein VGF16_14645 [Bryobacteraceae bacterium]